VAKLKQALMVPEVEAAEAELFPVSNQVLMEETVFLLFVFPKRSQ
jgi:hypothetical protein